MIKTLLSTAILTISFSTISYTQQHTVGLLSYHPMESFDGYNLIYPHNQPNVYLLDNCGEIVHTWTDDVDFRPGNTAYIMEDGNLVKTKRPAVVAGDPIWAGGGGAVVEILDWNNNVLWSFEQNDSLRRLHHDIAVIPSTGNILMLSWELKTDQESIQAGRDSAKLAQGKLWPEYIFEIDPATDEIVWEWHVWDHLIQDHDATKDHFGVVAEHPELIDINYDTHDGHPDWLHANALVYHEELKQIMLSVPYFHEIWVIDHTTTTAEAASHNGGFSGKGGDLMYRWGNPAAYQKGTEADQKFFFQHDAHWADDFLDITHPDYGKIILFNNRVGADFSTVNTFVPAWDMYSWSYTMDDGVFEPADFDWTFTHPEPSKMYSTGLSSAQILPNGNTLIDVGRFGYSFEVTPSNEIVWEYKTPLLSGQPVAQGDTLEINNNLTFRINRYPKDYSVFDGKDLSSKGFIEQEPDTAFCDLILSSVEVIPDYQLQIYPNPADNILVIEWEGMDRTTFKVFDLLGREMDHFYAYGGRKYMDTSKWNEGIYFIRINQEAVKKVIISR